MKIAVASSDGQIIDQHFGQACHFLIFQMGEEGLDFLELREKKEPEYAHEHRWKKAIELVTDCGVIFCRRIGDEPRQKLEEMGIEIVLSKKKSISSAITGYLSSLIQDLKSHKCDDEE